MDSHFPCSSPRWCHKTKDYPKHRPRHLHPHRTKGKSSHQMILNAHNGQAASKPGIGLGKRRENVYKSQDKSCATADRKRREESLFETGIKNSVALCQGLRNRNIRGNMFSRRLHCGFKDWCRVMMLFINNWGSWRNRRSWNSYDYFLLRRKKRWAASSSTVCI